MRVGRYLCDERNFQYTLAQRNFCKNKQAKLRTCSDEKNAAADVRQISCNARARLRKSISEVMRTKRSNVKERTSHVEGTGVNAELQRAKRCLYFLGSRDIKQGIFLKKWVCTARDHTHKS